MSPLKEKTRQTVNAAIHRRKISEGVVDFDGAVHGPTVPADLRREFDPGDHLHPNHADLRAMGEAVNLMLVRP